MAKPTTPAFEAVNAESVKEPRIVIAFEGLPYAFSTDVTYAKIRYDDPGVFYDGTYQYDGVRPLDTNHIKTLLDRQNTKMTISQKLEQWDGKASVETYNLALIDKDSIITQLITPGFLLPEILNTKVRVYFGYKDLAFPEDYIRIFTGYVNKYTTQQGKILFDLTDPSSRRKQDLFNGVTALLTADASPSDTSIFVDSNTGLYRTILDAKGNNDATVTIGVLIGNEIMTYTNADCVSPTQINVLRGQFNTVAESHSTGDKVEAFILFIDNPITIALKLMLSGFNAPSTTDVGVRGIINTDDGFQTPDSITFDQGVDLVAQYGLTIGDYIILHDFSIPANNAVFTIASFINGNRTVTVQELGVLQQENPPTLGDLEGSADFRSKYDTYPVDAGLLLPPDDVLVSRHEELRDTFIPFDITLPVKSFESSGKTFIETHLMKPIGAYTLTQGARCSMGLTHPPLASDLTRILDNTNIVNPKEIQVVRGLDERFFYNEIFFNYGYDPVGDKFTQSFIEVDQVAIDRMHQVNSLQIDCRGFPDNPTSRTILSQRAKRLLLRYRYAAETIACQAFFGVGCLIDAGDIIVLSDSTPAQLQIPNTETGVRGVINRVMEVQERTIDVSQGKTTVKLLSNNGFSITDRYGVIAPASIVSQGIDSQTFRYQESFGARFPNQEYLKWTDYQGLVIVVHSLDYTRNATSTFKLDKSDPFLVHLDSALPFTPQVGDIMEFANYDESSAASQSAIKSPYVFISNTGIIDHATSNAVIVLTAGEGANYIAGNTCFVMSPNGTTRFSPEVKILSVIGDVVTVGPILPTSPPDFGFLAQAGDQLKLGGFKDLGQSYRFV